MKKIELLAPAGNLERLKVALAYGADAVYIGGQKYSLRARASNFTISDINEAVKEAKIREAQGEAEAILVVQKALADSITLLNEANPTQAVLTLKSYEAFEKAADGKATKMIVPSEIQSLASLVTSVKELTVDEKAEK